ncbi:hypothetical protein PtA15_6A455 [Puccinia triticina]|uniref:Uncharacterized protein n=1 Tax=Puccinia triticina TaxID=208348 RepID=A0ABY7CNX3_9BASI|nr:uncharacterized protein PtA15_6A455 [Puccinia triticina]WAQ85826.1 hypothetical protein PtA15_6A455 [Puccinia triticina]
MASPEEPEGGNPPGPSRIDRILGRFQRMRLSHHPSHEQPPGAQQPHPTAQWQRTSCQRPAAQSKTWYAPQRPPIPSPPQNPSGSPIRMPLPIPASRPPAPPSPPINHPKPIAFPIPQPTGKKPQALPPSPTPLNTNHARPTEARPNNNTMSASHPKPAASKPLSSSNKLNINLPSPIQTPSKPTPNAPNPWHSNPAGKVAIDLTGPTSPNPAKHQSTASKPPTPHRKPSKTEPLAAAKPSTPSKPATQTSRPPKTPTITAATSPSDSPTATPSATGRCAGTTQQGKPCSRRPMKASEGMAERFDELDAILGLSSSAHDDPSPTPHSTVPRFCFQHYHKTRAQEGAWFANSTWVKFSGACPLVRPARVTIAGC